MELMALAVLATLACMCRRRCHNLDITRAEHEYWQDVLYVLCHYRWHATCGVVMLGFVNM